MLEHWTKYLNIKILCDYSKIIVCKNCLKHVSPLLLIPSLLCDDSQSHLELNQKQWRSGGFLRVSPNHHHWLIDNHLLLLCFQSLSVQCLTLRDSNMLRYLLHRKAFVPWQVTLGCPGLQTGKALWRHEAEVSIQVRSCPPELLAPSPHLLLLWPSYSHLPFSPVISLSAWMSFFTLLLLPNQSSFSAFCVTEESSAIIVPLWVNVLSQEKKVLSRDNTSMCVLKIILWG